MKVTKILDLQKFSSGNWLPLNSNNIFLKVSSDPNLNIWGLITENKYGKQFLNIGGDTTPFKDKLGRNGLGFKYFQGKWGMPMQNVDQRIKDEIKNMFNIDIDSLPVPVKPDIKIEENNEEGVEEDKNKSTADKELEEIKKKLNDAKKEAAGQDRAKILLEYAEKMVDRVAELTDEASKSEFIRSFLAFAAKFYQYSFGNQFLIWIQKPSATYVRTAIQWQEMGRNVNVFENPIYLLRPQKKTYTVDIDPQELIGLTPEEIKQKTERTRVNFSSFKVYDISDTQAIPNWTDKLGNPPFEPASWRKDSNEEIDEITDLINACIDFASSKNIDLDSESLKNDLGGYSSGGVVRINDSFKGINLFSTIVHELAHEMLHWEYDYGSHKLLNRNESRMQKEIDAETTAYIVLQHYGYESKDTPNYLALWKAKSEDIKNRKENIAKAVNLIITGINSNLGINEKKKDKLNNLTSSYFLNNYIGKIGL